MEIPQQFLDNLTSRCDIVDVVSSYVTLTRKGSNYFGLCPFHNEKTSSFSVAPDKQIYHCFGCGKGGSVIGFIMEMENLSFPDAVRFLARRVGMDIPTEDFDRERSSKRQRILQLNKESALWFFENLAKPEGAAVAAYLQKRRIGRKTAKNFGLGASLDSWDSLMTTMLERGYSKRDLLDAGLAVQNEKGRIYDKFRNRLMLPVINVRGEVVGFGSRVLDNSLPKYMNTSDTLVYSKRHTLYGLHLAKKTKRPNIILCEGNIDVLTLHQAGFDNAVASMGTALTAEQIHLLGRYTKELVLCYDNDTAGQNATKKAIALLEKSKFNVRVLQLPMRLVDGVYVKQDVDDFIKSHGSADFEAILSGSTSQMDFRMEAVAAKYNLEQADQRVAYSEEISRLIASVPNAVEREVYAGRAAEKAGVSREAMLMEVKRALSRNQGAARREIKKENLNLYAARQPKDRSLHYDDMRSAMAEEGIIRLLFLDETLFERCDDLKAEDFSSPLLGRIYALQQEAIALGQPLSLSWLEGQLTPGEMGHLTKILQKPESLAAADRSLPDYIEIIKESSYKRRRVTDVDPLLAAQNKYKRKKGYGGKQNGQ